MGYTEVEALRYYDLVRNGLTHEYLVRGTWVAGIGLPNKKGIEERDGHIYFDVGILLPYRASTRTRLVDHSDLLADRRPVEGGAIASAAYARTTVAEFRRYSLDCRCNLL